MSSSVQRIRARFKGACYSCRRPIAEGDPIGYDREAKRTYCYPECAEPTPVAPSPPSVERQLFSAPSPSGAPPPPPFAVALSALVARFRGAIVDAFPAQYWVRAEILRLNQKSSGMVFLELADSTDERHVSAQIHARISPRDRARILGRFAVTTGTELSEGMAILAAVSVEFDRYGLKLLVRDIDPSYTAGAQLVAAREILERLEAEDVIARNRSLPSPRDFTRVAVVAPDGAQGLDDFRTEADRLDEAGLCAFVYRTARFAGDGAAASLRRALEGVAAQHESAPYDAVVLLRGGGASANLVALNDHALARDACLMPIPVFTAIGHESDQTLLDLVAHGAFGTPSKVAGHIASMIFEGAERAHQAFVDTHRIADHIVTSATAAHEALVGQIETLAREQRARIEKDRAVDRARAAGRTRGIPYDVALPFFVSAAVAVTFAAFGHPILALGAFAAGAVLALRNHRKRRDRL